MVLEWLTETFNKVLTEEKILIVWKRGIVIASYKEGRKQDLGKYRGIIIFYAMACQSL